MKGLIAVTGGLGFIGRHVVAGLSQAGRNVRVIDNGSSPIADRSEMPSVDVRKIDLRSAIESVPAFDGASECIAIAARSGGTAYFNRHSAEILADNLKITINTLEACRSARVARVIFISSSCVYDNCRAHPATEEALDDSPAPTGGYPFSKFAGEHLCRAYQEQFGLAYTIIRPFNVYGPGEVPADTPGIAHVIPDLTAKALSGDPAIELFGDGSHTRSFTHVSDVARGIISALGNPAAENQAFNLGTDEEISIQDLAKMIWRLSGRVDTPRLVYAPGFPIDVQRRAASYSKASALMRWKPMIQLPEGLKSYITWYEGRRGH